MAYQTARPIPGAMKRARPRPATAPSRSAADMEAADARMRATSGRMIKAASSVPSMARSPRPTTMPTLQPSNPLPYAMKRKAINEALKKKMK